MKPILILGDVVVDVTLKSSIAPIKMRLGGIVHASRGAWSMNCKFHIAYFAPTYLEKQIASYLQNISCDRAIPLGDVDGAPYVFLIQDVKETGDQGYEFLLRDRIAINYKLGIALKGYDDVLMISGSFDASKVVKLIEDSATIHIDVANNVEDLEYLKSLNRRLGTIFISTSSTIFRKFFKDDFQAFAELFRQYTDRLVLKENRGGSRGIDFNSGEVVAISSQTQPIEHSVGVGDVYNTCYVNYYRAKSFSEALTLASWVASEYAVTTFPDDFKKNVQRTLETDVEELKEVTGVSLPWEKRKQFNIYIAGPDFDFMNVDLIDKVESSLLYHNFSPHRPIKENGQMEPNASSARKRELFDKDISLLSKCQLLIAVLLNNDPGTLVEIGLAEGLRIPAIVYDPYNIATNCMLTELPRLVSNDLDKVICEVFILASKINGK